MDALHQSTIRLPCRCTMLGARHSYSQDNRPEQSRAHVNQKERISHIEEREKEITGIVESSRNKNITR
jgi:hypothetical protein